MSDETRLVDIFAAARPYRARIGRNLMGDLAAFILDSRSRPQIHVIADHRVWSLHAAEISRALNNAGVAFNLSPVAAGESSKSLDGLAAILNDLSAAGHERSDLLVALGGGVTTDLAGFAAAIWLRGVPWICCPTSLECAIDAGIGGKTGINFAKAKNLVGAFHAPVAVFIDLDLMATLPARDYVAALAESVKHGIAVRPEFITWQTANARAILERNPAVLGRLIETNVSIKAGVVADDERETSATSVGRAVLNLGHTIGHALEALPEQDLRHGEAVALGLHAALSIAESELAFPPEARAESVRLMDRFTLPRHAPVRFDPDEVLGRMHLDKKSRDGRVRFVLPRRPGELVWWSADNIDPVRRALAEINPPAA